MKRPITSRGNPPDNIEIYETLFSFIDDVLFQYKPSTKEEGENKITQNIEKYLSEIAHLMDTFFAFQNQSQPIHGNVSTDIEVYLRDRFYTTLCWIEAKRLPTPDGGKIRDEREYVFVDKKRFDGGGGVQRFKEGQHAPNLHITIMFGYIQENNDVDYWLSKINNWILDLAKTENGFWSYGDCLRKNDSNKCNRLLSEHKRHDETKIVLHHYWIKV